MKANLLKTWNEMEFCELDKPVAAKGEAVIRMLYAGVCGSDVTVYSGKHPSATAPVVVGHEILGIIESINPDGDCEFKVGDRVTVDPLISCGECGTCRRGAKHVCRSLKLLGIHVNGGYAEYTCAEIAKLVKVPESLADEIAVLAEPFAVGAHVTARSGIQSGDKALVIGGGPIGIIVALCAIYRGAEVYVSEPNDKRRALAESLGINCINPLACDMTAKIAELTGEGFDVIYEASGSKAGIALCCDACRIRGTIVPLLLSGAPVEFPLGKVSFKELSVIGSRVYTPEHFREGVAMLADISAKLELRPLASDILPLSEAKRAIEMMINGENAGKILIKCN